MTSEQRVVVAPRKASEAREDYLETIAELFRLKGFAALSDIAEKMNVSKPTVTHMVKKLHNEGYVLHERYRGISLTDSGRSLARKMRRNHNTLTRLLEVLGVPERIAWEDAEKIEHGLHSECILKLQDLVELLEEDSELAQKLRAKDS